MASWKPSSLVSIGDCGLLSSWLCSSSINLRVRGSAPPASVQSKKASSWLSVARATRLGGGERVGPGGRATWIWGGGRDSAVLMGRVVTLAVTGSSLSWKGWSCLLKGDISVKEK